MTPDEIAKWSPAQAVAYEDEIFETLGETADGRPYRVNHTAFKRLVYLQNQMGD